MNCSLQSLRGTVLAKDLLHDDDVGKRVRGLLLDGLCDTEDSIHLLVIFHRQRSHNGRELKLVSCEYLFFVSNENGNTDVEDHEYISLVDDLLP